MNKKAIAVFAALVFLTQSIPAYADGRRGGGFRDAHHDFRPNYRHDYVAHRLPAGYISLLVGGLTLLYCEGLFYRYSPAGYVVVQPPVGAVIPALPAGYTTVMVHSRPYYVYGYTYYDYTPTGYTVVNPPTYAPAIAPVVTQNVAAAAPQIQAPAPVIQQAAPQAPAAPLPAAAPKAEEGSNVDTFEIHLPNGDGTFTLVTLKQTSTGFLGPQGEFYPDHPTVDQLKERYIAKKKT